MILPRKTARSIANERTTILILPKAPTYSAGSRHKVLYRSRDDFGKPFNDEMCRILVTGVTATTLDQITGVQSLLAGFRDLAELYDDWRERFNDGPLSEPPVWIVAFELDRSHVVHLLAASRGDEHGYTENPHNAMDQEPEAVPAAVQREFTKEAGVVDLERKRTGHAARREAYASLLQRLHAEALGKGTDVTADIRVIERRLAAIDRKLGRAA